MTVTDNTMIAERAATRAEKIRILRLALSAFIVESNGIARELEKGGHSYMSKAVSAEIKTASDLLSECPNLVS